MSIHSVLETFQLIASISVIVSTIQAVWAHRPISERAEASLFGLKVYRVLMVTVLVCAQGSIVLLLLQHKEASQWSFTLEGTLLTALVAWQACQLLLWRRLGSLRLLPITLCAQLSAGAALGADCVPDPSNEAHAYDADRVASIVGHAVLVVVLLAAIVVEMVVLAHVDALLAGDVEGGEQAEPLLDKKDKKDKKDKDKDKSKGEKAMRRQSLTRMKMMRSAFRYVLPDSPGLRTRLAGCFVLVALERCANLAVPLLYKHMVDTLSQASALRAAADAVRGVLSNAAPAAHSIGVGTSEAVTSHAPAAHASLSRMLHQLMASGGLQGSSTAANTTASATAGASAGIAALASVSFWSVFHPWVTAYLAAYFLRGGSGMEGLLASMRDILWAPITQAAFRRVSLDVFGHLLELDHAFHVKRKTGTIMRILDRGTSSIQDTVSIILFNVLPQMADIVVACVYLATSMQPWAAAIVAVTVASYVPLTVIITERRGEVRKRMNALDNAREARATDMLLNYETVKLFCAEALELGQFDAATRQYQAAEYWQLAFLALLAIVQGCVVWVGLVTGAVVCVRGVAQGSLTVGDAVLFITLMNQLYVPLTYFGSYYRQVQKALVDVENMFELLATPPQVHDAPGAKPLRVTSGSLTFQNVVFGYHPGGEPVLKGVSFQVPGGKTIALVGSTGSGKSTILKLLLRFYDPWSGAVLIDGQDIKTATLGSVRRTIAVVPQDTVLFNQSIAYNIRYGAPGARMEEVAQAAAVAHIHDAITASFKKGYDTRVGERGLRLSGGEKQRIAFARAVLKRPSILVLDEATSALDTLTEHQINASLATIRSRVTTVIVAHRLSTVMDADIILVLAQGRVAQVGSHAELLEQGGLYASMWSRQQDATSMSYQDLADLAARADAAGSAGSGDHAHRTRTERMRTVSAGGTASDGDTDGGLDRDSGDEGEAAAYTPPPHIPGPGSSGSCVNRSHGNTNNNTRGLHGPHSFRSQASHSGGSASGIPSRFRPPRPPRPADALVVDIHDLEPRGSVGHDDPPPTAGTPAYSRHPTPTRTRWAHDHDEDTLLEQASVTTPVGGGPSAGTAGTSSSAEHEVVGAGSVDGCDAGDGRAGDSGAGGRPSLDAATAAAVLLGSPKDLEQQQQS